ncbi:MAG: hypothetical protein ACD_80C00031G0001 [uncultured bacterium (gcode 4)]|uniref:DUF192 domain-containing protein n=1 Tax=uncultured bacterium (gcode 4) TaxID=1234023 RepID=K1XK35_9BACT|nr:MAG: hypothetical protein ACD_80C00031G0001 [uncultured bacterium (gcode 4)]
MSKKIIWLSAIICILIIITSLLLLSNRKSQTGKPIFINNQRINVEIADTDSLRSKGLSGRKSLDQNAGMLFIFPKTAIYSFWMKEMNFPLDIIWINGETIEDITENIPNTKYKELSELPLYSPKVPVDKVLEVNSGTVKLLNIKIGDKVVL